MEVISESLGLDKSYFKENICKESGGYLLPMRYPCNLQKSP